MNLMAVERLRELFDMDCDGRLFWRVRPNRGQVRAGDAAGCARGDGYIVLKIDGRAFLAHRIVFAMKHGRWPTAYIDHVNGNPSDNRPENLREATARQNLFNSPRKPNNTSGFKGVRRRNKSGKFAAEIRINGKKKYLGAFPDAESASAAYIAAANAHQGEFANRAGADGFVLTTVGQTAQREMQP